jgi:hypothetical protein
LAGEKLAAASALVEDQLRTGYIELTDSPWHTPIFVIRKKSGRWRFLQDLRAVNRVIQPVGVLQPGLPSPTAIPLDYCLCILNLKDAFLAIPLHSKDRKFCFHFIITKSSGPWALISLFVLPQVMANSPTMCQEVVAAAIEPTCHKYPEAYVLHYMDDILISHLSEFTLLLILADLTKKLEAWGLCIAPEKVQKKPPFLIFRATY